MDFLDYQTFVALDSTQEESRLPEPASRLNLSSLPADQTEENVLNLPAVLHTTPTGSGDLHGKMAAYAKNAIESLDTAPRGVLNDIAHQNGTNVMPLPSKKMDATNLVLSQKLSKILNSYSFSNYHTVTQLGRSFQMIEQAKKSLGIDEEKLTSPDYVGSLARKGLRGSLETELLKQHVTVLEEFKPIARKTKKISPTIDSINHINTTLFNSKNEDVTASQVLLNSIEKLQQTRTQLALKKQILELIKTKFTLTQLEDDIILNGSVNEAFYEVVNKVMKIKATATILLSLPNAEAGRALFQNLSTTLQLLNKKIFHYLADFLQVFDTASDQKLFTPSDTSLSHFQKGLIYLSNDLEYFDDFLKKVTTFRSKVVLDQFLSQFDVNTTSNPVMLSAHDPVRYVGDILANVHSLIANENDFVKTLFKFKDEHMENTPTTILQKNQEYIDGLDSRLLNKSVQSLANSCKIRVEQVVRFETAPVPNFEILKLLELYKLMFMRKGLESTNILISNINSLIEISQSKILEYFVHYGENVPSDISDDLLPPEWLTEYLNKLCELFEKYEVGLENDDSSETPLVNVSFLQITVEKLLQKVLIPKIEAIFPQAKKNEAERSSLLTVKINCFDLVSTRLQPFSPIFDQDEQCKEIWLRLQTSYSDTIEKMKQLQTKLLFEKTGLQLYYNLLNMIFPLESVQDELDLDMYQSVTENSLMHLDTLRQKVHPLLNEYIPQAMTDVQDYLLFKITSPTVADSISETAFNKLSFFYKLFRKILVHIYPEEKQQILDNILNFAEEEFDTLIGVETSLTL